MSEYSEAQAYEQAQCDTEVREELKRAPAPRTPLRLNRNFMNYPLARDARVQCSWSKSKKGNWIARLPGEDRILLILPADTGESEQRAPTALDMAVLFALLAEVQRTSAAQITFTYATLLRQLGLTVRQYNRNTVRSALALWGRLTLQISCWHEIGVKHQVRKRLPPPVVACEQTDKHDEQTNRITIHADWVRLAFDNRYYAAIPLPLPLMASDQNAVLLILTTLWRDESSFDVYHERRQSAFARKAGLSTVRRKTRLTACLDRVVQWFRKMDGALDVVFGRSQGVVEVGAGRIKFLVQKPRVPRVKRSATNVAKNKTNVAPTRAETYEERWYREKAEREYRERMALRPISGENDDCGDV